MNAVANEKILTTGEFLDEPLAWDAFDEIAVNCGAFRVYREVKGEYVQPRIETTANGNEKGARIDRVLVPTAKLMNAGWKNGGAIGVEGKRSGNKIGPLVTQAIDYSRCAFRMEQDGNLFAAILLRWIFVYPVDNVGGDFGSVMANNRIGTCWIDRGRLRFGCTGTIAITVSRDGSIEAKDLTMGNKRGSR